MIGRAAARLAPAALVALLAFLPWREGGADPLGLFVTHTLVFILLGFAIFQSRASSGLALAVGWEAPMGILLAASCVVSCLGSGYLFGSFLSTWNVLMAVVLAGALTLLGAPIWRRCLTVVAAAGAAEALAVLLLPSPKNLTPSGTFANGNHAAAYLNIAMLVTLGLCLDRPTGVAAKPAARAKLEKGACLVAILLELLALMKTGSRGALLSLGAVLFVGAAASARRLSPRLRLAAAGLMLLVAIGAVAAVWLRFQRIEDSYRYDRPKIWMASLQTAREAPLLGVGPGMFAHRGYAHNFPQEESAFRYSKTPTSTHNLYLEALTELGVVGLAITLALIALVARGLLATSRAAGGEEMPARGALMALAATLVHGIVETPLDVPAITLTLVALVVPLLARRSPREAPILIGWPWHLSNSRRLAAAVAVVVLSLAYAAGVARPYWAHRSFEEALERSRPGVPDAALARAIELNPYNPLYYAERARIVWRPDMRLDPATFAAAHEDLSTASQLNPWDPDHLANLARLHARACADIRPDRAAAARAEEYFRAAIALGRKDPRPHLELAIFLISIGRGDDGMMLLKEALELEPRFLGARFSLARALYDAGRRVEALAAFEQFERARDELASYAPKNGYEVELMRYQQDAVARLRSDLGVGHSSSPGGA